MLSKADDFPIHQTADPIAYAGTDRNFYDRYFFNGYNADGSEFFAVAFGVYPHLNIADAHFAVIRDGVEHCVHASRVLNMERWDLEVGPIRIEVVEPLKRLKVTVAPTDGIAAEIAFEGRAFPLEEKRSTYRHGPRMFMDSTRLTQNGRYAGWIEVDGRRETLKAGAIGVRDRSWGVRPIGAPDAQPMATGGPRGLFWQWTPLNFERRSVYYHFFADETGEPWTVGAAVVADGAGADGVYRTDLARMAVTFLPETRHAGSAELTIPMRDAAPIRVAFEPFQTFVMRGIGYTHPTWGHGRHHGELAVEREDIPLADLNHAAFENMHIQALSKVTLVQDGQPTEKGIGVFEQLSVGPFPPLGLT
jgi:hypothetical protein